MAIIAKHLTISGKVQGVFYRGWAVKTARSLGLTGWVRNRRNGDVEAVVQGQIESVARFLALARRGPSAARVETIDAEDIPVSDLKSFEQHATS